jgi:UDP:flavonoid glycosyltransferase YjiC (YdhE family)
VYANEGAIAAARSEDRPVPDQAAPRDILFVTFDGGGNIPPLLGAARRLLARGHRIRVMSETASRRDVEAAGLQFIPYASPQHQPIAQHLAERPEVGHGSDVLAELRRRPAHLCVGSDLMFGPMIAAEAAAVPFAILAPNICLLPLPGGIPPGAGLRPPRNEEERKAQAHIADASRDWLDTALPALNAERHALGLPPLAHVLQQTDVARRILLATSAAFDFPCSAPPKLRHVGPELDDPPWADTGWVSPWPDGDRRPLVLVAFSSTDQGQTGIILRTIDALATMPVRVLATVGAAPELLASATPANVVIRRAVPHRQVMLEASAVVSHCGHGTVMKALAAGLPILCLPMGQDQHDNAARVVDRGAGLELPPGAESGAIAEALHRLLGESAFRASAACLGAAIRRDAENSTLVAEIEELSAP